MDRSFSKLIFRLLLISTILHVHVASGKDKSCHGGDAEGKIKKIVMEQLGLGRDPGLDETFEDLGADDLDKVELIMAFEEAFSIQIPDEDAKNIVTAGQALNYICTH